MLLVLNMRVLWITKTKPKLLDDFSLSQSVCSLCTLECSWLHSAFAASSCCKQRKSFCWSRCCVPSSHLPHIKARPTKEQTRLKDSLLLVHADGSITTGLEDTLFSMHSFTCTSIEVVSSTTLFITARTFRGSMVFTQSRVSTLFLSIWEIIRPWTCTNKGQDSQYAHGWEYL